MRAVSNLFRRRGHTIGRLSAVAIVVASCGLLVFTSCTTLTEQPEQPPPAPREFRAAWVATVANIDWPSKPGLPVERQRAEMTALLDRARDLKLNAIILQVRPAADALYASPLEPWSEFLTGTQGRPPEPFYDPLHEWIAGAHVRGMELHAWFNPYRARHFAEKSPLAPTHIAKTHPALVKKYGEYLWMDPGELESARRTLEVIRDVVRRYDIDGVHIDDYFYPYPIPSGKPPAIPGTPPPHVDFPDEPSWRRYIASGGTLSRADWRRQNVNRLVEELHRTVHAIKPWVRFGISPFGVGRPDRRPAGIQGLSQYDQLYADVELWLERGWMDYIVPQLYWPIEQRAQAFGVLLEYWAQQNVHHRHLWPGLFTSSLGDAGKKWKSVEIIRQIDMTRQHPAATGHAHYSMIALMQNREDIVGALRAAYAEPALIPAAPWLDATPPEPPALLQGGPNRLLIQPRGLEPASSYAIWKRHGTQWRFSVQTAAETSIDLTPDSELGPVESVAVSTVDRLRNESPRAVWRAPRP